MGIREWFLRWRASRGYGVHSPLGYRIVRHVVRPPHDVRYYGEDILGEKGSGRTEIASCRLLLRFVAEMQPAYVWVSKGLPEPYREAISLAGCVVRIFDGAVFPGSLAESDMAVLYGAGLSAAELAAFLHSGRSLIAFRSDAKVKNGKLASGPRWSRFVETVAKAMPAGVLLESPGILLAVATPPPSGVSRGSALHRYSILTT